MNAHDPTDIDAQERELLTAQERAKLGADLEKKDIQWLMGTPRGRRIVYRILDRAAVFQVTFDTNALRMAFAEGRKNEGYALLGLILAHCPDRYIEMIKERNANAT